MVFLLLLLDRSSSARGLCVFEALPLGLGGAPLTLKLTSHSLGNLSTKKEKIEKIIVIACRPCSVILLRVIEDPNILCN